MVVGFVIARSKTASRLFMPYFIGANTIPSVALAPFLVLWFGFGILPRIATSVMVSRAKASFDVRYELYRTQAVPGKVRTAGPGTGGKNRIHPDSHSAWRQDRRGRLFFQRGGIQGSRSDLHSVLFPRRLRIHERENISGFTGDPVPPRNDRPNISRGQVLRNLR